MDSITLFTLEKVKSFQTNTKSLLDKNYPENTTNRLTTEQKENLLKALLLIKMEADSIYSLAKATF
jgi:hypothetical protein